MEEISIKELLEAGAHFGHQTDRWHPRMRSYIFTQRGGIHIIDLEQTVKLLDKACAFARELIVDGQFILFVGTKKQAQGIIEDEAKRCGMFYANQRWLGGMLTNFSVIQSRIDYLVELEDKQAKGELNYLPKKERLKLEEKISRLNRYMGGFKEMTGFPGALFIVDPVKDKIALDEARKVNIPVIAIVDTNCNPEPIDYPIPANDDAIKAIKLIASKMANAVLEGKALRESTELAVEAGAELMETYTFMPEDKGEEEKESENWSP